MRILAIESSCDETSCAVIEDGTKIISNVVASSTSMHEKYGGIVPEVAARAQLESILPVISEALKHLMSSSINNYQLSIINSIDALAVTVGPGLIGSLLVGVETAKTIAYVTGKPIIPVNHVLAHMYGNFLQPTNSLLPTTYSLPAINFPAISLVVSGGHTELFLMKSIKDLQWLGGTLDDAAGEAFDKTARLLGFGSRGGLAIQESAQKLSTINSQLSIKLPRPLMYDKTLNFSFSGLKTAILREVNKLKEKNLFNNETIQELAYEVQETITDVLVFKTLNAAKIYNAKSILLSGGVAANLRLRDKFKLSILNSKLSISFSVPPPSLCTDNAAYIGSYAYFRGTPEDWHTITALPDLMVEIK